MKKRILMKLGGRKHLGEERWRGALKLFDEVYCVCTYRDPTWNIENDRVKIIMLPRKSISKNMIGILVRTKKYRMLTWFNWMLIFAIRLVNKNWLKQIASIEADEILCSYGDYDLSDMTYLLAKPAIKGTVIRSYKESRPEYNFLEYYTFKSVDKVVFYDVELKYFLEKKYGTHFFDGKKVQVGYDENVLPSCILKNIDYKSKFSLIDGRIHVVILTYRVDSTKSRERDQGRYYYIDMIEKLIKSGAVVHLHCAQYNNDKGINRYELLKQDYPDNFYMEPPLEMKYSTNYNDWIKSCEILSRYDVGILHNIIKKTSVSEFDRINIPHRYFAYEAAHVAPVIIKGENTVLEKMFLKNKNGLIVEQLEDISELKNISINYDIRSYEEYLHAIFDM